MNLQKIYFAVATLSGFSAVLLGAFGAHGLRSKVSETALNAWQTGVQYQMYHVFALLAVALLMDKWQGSKWLAISGALYILGSALFSGSLYCLALGGPKYLGPVTPLGGLCLMLGWAILFLAVLQRA